MPWKKNRKLLAEGYRDLAYLPRGRSAWDATLSSLAYGVRMELDKRPPDLSAWAARHGLPASALYEELGPRAFVLWHGTSRPRAERIREHGLFHKRGLWTTSNPLISHSYCRWRSERFGTEGAVVCVVLDPVRYAAGRDYEIEGRGDVLRFMHGLPPDAVAYVLTHDGIEFTAPARAKGRPAWPCGAFRHADGHWAPVQKTPVRFSDAQGYSSLAEFTTLCLERLFDELGEVTALEVFSTLYALVRPREALRQAQVFALLESLCVPSRRRGKIPSFARRQLRGAAQPPPT